MPAKDRVIARIASSSASCVSGSGSEEMRRDWCSRERARKGWEGGRRPAELRMGRSLVVRSLALAVSKIEAKGEYKGLILGPEVVGGERGRTFEL